MHVELDVDGTVYDAEVSESQADTLNAARERDGREDADRRALMFYQLQGLAVPRDA